LFNQDEILKRLYAAKPVSASGTHLAYHAVTAGYILGEIIKRVTGQNVRVFAENIEKPMLMIFNYGLNQNIERCCTKLCHRSTSTFRHRPLS
jgi:hypothetical protein